MWQIIAGIAGGKILNYDIIVASGAVTKIESYVHISSNCYLLASSGLIIEDFSGLAVGVNIFTGSDGYPGKKLTNPTISRVYIGGAS